MDSDQDQARPPKFYGRRAGKSLRAHHAALVETLLPRLRLPAPDKAWLDDPASLFAPPAGEVWLEIGFGGGEHIASLAAANPQVGLIGAEAFVNGVAKLLALVEAAGLRNIRIHDNDIRPLLPRLAPASLSRVYLLYPDPWPKARHHKRRFVNQDNLSQIHRLLKSGGQFLFASDIAGYVRWTLAEVSRHGGFEWCAETAADWRQPPDGWPGTRYEAKALSQGRTPAYLRFRRL